MPPLGPIKSNHFSCTGPHGGHRMLGIFTGFSHYPNQCVFYCCSSWKCSNSYTPHILQAAYTVGGHSFNAATIEYCLLKSKSTATRPQIVRIYNLSFCCINVTISKFNLAPENIFMNFWHHHVYCCYMIWKGGELYLSQLLKQTEKLTERLITHFAWNQMLLMALHRNKLTEGQMKFGIEQPEPLINFALCCGTRSAPMVCKNPYTIDCCFR